MKNDNEKEVKKTKISSDEKAENDLSAKLEDRVKKDNKNLITKAIVALLCVFFVVGFIWGLNRVLNMEGSYPPVVNAASLTECPETPGEALEYLNRIIKKAQTEKPKLETSDAFDINEESITVSGSEELKKTLLFIRSDADSALEESFTKQTAEYGVGFGDKLWVPSLNVSDIESIETSYIYYVCPSCGEESDEPQSHCEKCGYEDPYNMKYRDEYTIKLILKASERPVASDSALGKNFHIRTDEQIASLSKGVFDGILNINSIKTSYENVYIQFKVNRLTDEISELEYGKDIPVSGDITFTGSYSSLGGCDVSFNMNEKNVFTFTWPTIKLSAHEKSMEQKKTDNLNETVTCTDPTKVTVKWTSSNTEIATVDDEGYITSNNNDGKTTITASFEFNGKTYSDSCVVTVKTSVDELSLSKRKLKMTVGETYELTAKISPKDATVQTVTWYTSDKSVATVDENGKVTAISKGSVTVYALSDDGYYKSSCEVSIS